MSPCNKKGIKQTIRFLCEQCNIGRQTGVFVLISAPRDRHKAVTGNCDENTKAEKKYISKQKFSRKKTNN